MDTELKILKRLLFGRKSEEGLHGPRSWITTKELDSILEEEWGNKHDAGMHCNSMMRRGLIDYHCDGDWSLDYTEAYSEQWENEVADSQDS